MILQPDHIAIDYSFARPAPPTIASAGVKLVCRYISPVRTNKKNLTPLERDALHAEGLGILLVWENGQLDPLSGAPKGADHGKDARSYANDLGYPQDLPIIAAVDFDVQPAQMGVVMAYLQAFHGAGGPSGCYGKNTVITAAHDLAGSTLGWQTVAWSHGNVSPFADVLQHARPVHPTVPPLGAVDDNTVLRTFRAWSSLPDPPDPQPPQEIDMPTVITNLAARVFEGVTYQPGAIKWALMDDGTKRHMGIDHKLFGSPAGTPASNADLDACPDYVPPVTTIPPVVIPPITVPPLTGHLSADIDTGAWHITGSIG